MPDSGRRPSAVTTSASAPAPPRVRTLVVDDSEAVRDGLSLLLETQPYCELVGAVGDRDAALHLTRTAHPHVVLQDFSMPGLDTISLMRELAACDPRPVVLVLSAFADAASAERARSAGAVGWVLKDCEPDHLFAALLGAAGFRAPEAQDAGIGARPRASFGAADDPAPARREFEVATPLESRTLWALLRALESAPDGLTVEALATRAVVPATIAARYVQRVSARHPALIAAREGGPGERRYRLTPAGYGELARLEGRVPPPTACAGRLLR
jgi:DNA-binding NarL/FixJ family response regulator